MKKSVDGRTFYKLLCVTLTVVLVLFVVCWYNTLTFSKVYNAAQDRDVVKLCTMFEKAYKNKGENIEILRVITEELVKLNDKQAEEFIEKIILESPVDIRKLVCISYANLKSNFIDEIFEKIESMKSNEFEHIRFKSLILVNIAECNQVIDKLEALPYIIGKKIDFGNTKENYELCSIIKELCAKRIVTIEFEKNVDDYLNNIDGIYLREEIVAKIKRASDFYFLKNKAAMIIKEKKLDNYIMKYPQIALENHVVTKKINDKILEVVDRFENMLYSEFWKGITVENPKNIWTTCRVLNQNDKFISIRFSGSCYKIVQSWCLVFDKDTGELVPLNKFYNISLNELRDSVKTGKALVLDSSGNRTIPLSNNPNNISMGELKVDSIRRVSNNYIYIDDKIVALEYGKYELVSGCFGTPYIVLGVDEYDDKIAHKIRTIICLHE